MRRDEQRVGPAVAEQGALFAQLLQPANGFAVVSRQEIDLVECGDDRLPREVELAQRLVHRLSLLGRVGVRDVDDVDEEVRRRQLFESGPKGRDELGRQLLDEADGVGEENGAMVGELDAPRQGVERGEELVFGEDFGAGESPQEGALAGVGVADEGNYRHARTGTPSSIEGPLVSDGFDLALEAGDAVADEAAVGLELGFARAAGADGAFEPLQVAPLAGESRQEVLVLGELDLEAAFAGAGALGEDVDDERGAVEDFDLEGVFEGALLRWTELVVEDDEGVVETLAFGLDLRQLALADVVPGMGVLQLLDGAADDAGAGGIGEEGELIEGGLAAEGRGLALDVDGDEVGPFDGLGCRVGACRGCEPPAPL